MAGAHSATTSFITPLANPTPLQRPPPKLVCSLSIPSSSKPSNRKNYLRPKLLKTLKKPYTDPLLPDSTPVKADIPVESPPEQSPECSSDQLPCPSFAGVEQKEPESDELRQSETSSSARVIDDGVGIFSGTSMFKYGMYLIGFFVCQTVVSVWILSSANSDDTDENKGSEGKTKDLEFLINGKNKAKMELGIQKDEIVKVDESVLEKKIAEIRAMARDVREKEGVKSKENGLDDEDNDVDVDADDDDDDDAKSGIEKEVDNKLVILTKSLKKNYRKPVFFAGNSSKVGNDKDDFNAKMANDALMYKKKHRFRKFSSDPSYKAKGFQGSENDSVTKLKSKLIERADEMLKVESIAYNDMPIDDLMGNVSLPLEEVEVKKSPKEETKSLQSTRKNLVKEKGRSKPGKGFGAQKSQPLIGNNQLESTNERSPVRGVKAQNSQGFTKEKQDTIKVPYRSNVLSRENRFKGSKKPAKNVAKKKPESDPWWFSLRYALVILMRSSGDGEGPVGLYSFNGSSDEKGESSYTVAFEDHVDATNFCYILLSFFQDMEEFSADILPLSIKELEQEVESDNMKVLFVKKGKLKLYAGQPLEEVERALCSLI